MTFLIYEHTVTYILEEDTNCESYTVVLPRNFCHPSLCLLSYVTTLENLMTMCKSVLQLDLILWMLVGVYTVHIAMTVLVTALYHVSWERGTSNATQL